MNSSISSSDAAKAQAAGREPLWSRFCVVAIASALAITAVLTTLAYLVDPYDTGRPGLFQKAGIRPQGPRTAAASRGRDLAYNAAILGNSHVQLLSPERLKAASGADFVSLIAPATHPREQLVLLDWFIRHHREPPRAVVIGIDGNWCAGNAGLPNEKPFPFWLYERALLPYLAGLVRFDMLEETPRRIAYLMSSKAERARPDGYWDYEPNYLGLGYDVRPDRRAILERRQDAVPVNGTGRFPAAARLEKALVAVPAQTVVILLHPPVYHTALPRPGSAEASTDLGCKAAFAAVAETRPLTSVLDMRADGVMARDAALWFDHTHYRRAFAERIEMELGRMIMPR